MKAASTIPIIIRDTLLTLKNFHTRGIVSKGVANIANHKTCPIVSLNSSVIFLFVVCKNIRGHTVVLQLPPTIK